MSKILIKGNKVIIDGHANDLETCNTLTNLCDELSTSEKFRTVKYESGYGEFESVVENEEKKFPARTSIFIYYNDGTVAFIDNEVLLASNIEVTSTGLKIDNELRYIYDGNKVFLGFSDKANSTSATFPIGYKCSTKDMPINPKEEGGFFYIVEGIVIPEHHSSLNELFTNIASVIREKTGETGTIAAAQIPSVIRSSLQAIPAPVSLIITGSTNKEYGRVTVKDVGDYYRETTLQIPIGTEISVYANGTATDSGVYKNGEFVINGTYTFNIEKQTSIALSLSQVDQFPHVYMLSKAMITD